MLYITNLVRYPFTGSLQTLPNDLTKFQTSFYQNKLYKWTFSRALNEWDNDKILDYDEDNQILMISGLFDNPDKKYLKFNFDVRVRFSNGEDFSLATCDMTSTSIHNIVNKKLKLNSRIKKFVFQPYKDIVYITMSVKDNISEVDTEKINLKFETFGFDLLRK